MLTDIAKILDVDVRNLIVPPKEDHIHESRKEGAYFGDDVKHSFELIRRSDVVDGIEFYMNSKGDNDLVAILSRDHSMFHRIFKISHTHKFANHSHLPLLVLKDRV